MVTVNEPSESRGYIIRVPLAAGRKNPETATALNWLCLHAVILQLTYRWFIINLLNSKIWSLTLITQINKCMKTDNEDHQHAPAVSQWEERRLWLMKVSPTLNKPDPPHRRFVHSSKDCERQLLCQDPTIPGYRNVTEEFTLPGFSDT